MHTITIEPLPGTLAVVERYDGDLVKVCALAEDVAAGASMADVARNYATAYGAVYVAPGE